MTDNPAPVTPENQAPEAAPAAAPAASGGWKSSLSTDLQGSPLIGKFEDTPEGLNAAFTSHNNLETLLGHEKVPIPKGPDDSEGWDRFSRAMGIPDTADGYELPKAELPESMQGVTIDKAKFAEVVHANKLTPQQAQGLWDAYNKINIATYQQAQANFEKQMTETVNALKSEWGEAFDTNVELGQAVINKFGADQADVDYLTATLGKDPRGIKFLAKIGGQFAENKIGDFSVKRFSMSPEEAQNEIENITKDLNGPYYNMEGKHTQKEHDAAIERVNYLRASINKSKG